MIQFVVITNVALVVTFLSTLSFGIPRASSRNVNAKPDFNGTWNARIVQAGSTKLKISYQNPKLKISRISRFDTPVMVLGQLIPSGSSDDFIYNVDGRGETNRSQLQYRSPLQLGRGRSGGVPSKTTRVGQQFLITSSFETKKSGRQVNTEVTYLLEVSSDGSTLNLSMTIVSDGVRQEFEESYDRIEGLKSNDINGLWAEKPSESIVSLIVEHHDPEIKVTRRVLSQGREQFETYTYYSDGRGETNLNNDKPTKSTTKWDGNTLVISVSSLSRVGDDNIGYFRSVKWQMSSDAKSLTETTKTRSTSTLGLITPDSKETKLVFARSSSQLPGPVK